MKKVAIHTQGKNNPYGIEEGSITWVNKIDNSNVNVNVNDGEFIYFMHSKHSGTFGTVTANTVESLCTDKIYELSECKVYRLIDEEVKRVAKGMTANLKPLAYPHLENV